MPGDVLPCMHAPKVVAQIGPAEELLRGLSTARPDLLTESGIDPRDYHEGLVFRSAIESIRGSMAASGTASRHALVAANLQLTRVSGGLERFEPAPVGERFDFVVRISSSPTREAAVEVKGGEGNSLNISARPPWAHEFVVWCHIDGSLRNSPSHGVRSIIGRIASDIIKRKKQIDALLIRDAFCGSRLRPCPKYPSGKYPAHGPAPDVFLFPNQVPDIARSPAPAPHNEHSCLLPFRILSAYGVTASLLPIHVHHVSLRLFTKTRSGNPELWRELVVTQDDTVQFSSQAKV